MKLLCYCLVNVLITVFSSSSFKPVESSTVLKSSVAVIGDKVEMNCSVNGTDKTTWQFIAWNGTDITIYFGDDIYPQFKSRYTISKNISGQHNLIIGSVDYALAGRYQCTTTSNALWNDVRLVVLGSRPVCAANATKTHLSSWCRINCTENEFLVFTWTKSNAKTSVLANTTISDTNRVPVTYTSSIMEQLQVNESGVTFQCQITFQMTDNTERVHIHVYTWNHTLYGPRNLSIVRHDDRLECYADGDPTPTYRWLHLQTNTSTDGSIFELNNATMTSGNNNVFLCTANNVFANETKSFIIAAKVSTRLACSADGRPTTTYGWTHMKTDNTTGSIFTQNDTDSASITTSTTPSDFNIVPAAIGGSIFIFLITVIIVACIVHKKRLKDINSNRPDVASNTDNTAYDDIALNSEGPLSSMQKGDRLPEKSCDTTISDNAVYAEVCKPKGQAKGSKGGDNSKSAPKNKNQEKKNYVGEDGTVYAELSAMKPPASKGKVVAKSTPAFSQVEIYAAIDHSGTVPAPPLVKK